MRSGRPLQCKEFLLDPYMSGRLMKIPDLRNRLEREFEPYRWVAYEPNPSVVLQRKRYVIGSGLQSTMLALGIHYRIILKM